jgi:hypothetical protein
MDLTWKKPGRNWNPLGGWSFFLLPKEPFSFSFPFANAGGSWNRIPKESNQSEGKRG